MVFQSAVFDANATRAMGEAFDRACDTLHDLGQPDLVREIIAMRIIEVARDGGRDPNELCAQALKALGFSIPPNRLNRQRLMRPRRMTGGDNRSPIASNRSAGSRRAGFVPELVRGP
jgi:hypothetical protein